MYGFRLRIQCHEGRNLIRICWNCVCGITTFVWNIPWDDSNIIQYTSGMLSELFTLIKSTDLYDCRILDLHWFPVEVRDVILNGISEYSIRDRFKSSCKSVYPEW